MQNKDASEDDNVKGFTVYQGMQSKMHQKMIMLKDLPVYQAHKERNSKK